MRRCKKGATDLSGSCTGMYFANTIHIVPSVNTCMIGYNIGYLHIYTVHIVILCVMMVSHVPRAVIHQYY